MENEYTMTNKLLREYVYNSLCKKTIIICYVISILGFCMYILDSNSIMLTGSLTLLFITIVLPIITIKQIEETGKRLNNGKIEKTKVKFFDNIVMDEGKAHLEFEYSQIKQVIETKNLIILKISRQNAILVLKDGFIEGDYKKFLEFINDKIN